MAYIAVVRSRFAASGPVTTTLIVPLEKHIEGVAVIVTVTLSHCAFAW
jgi:hypothetical protein